MRQRDATFSSLEPLVCLSKNKAFILKKSSAGITVTVSNQNEGPRGRRHYRKKSFSSFFYSHDDLEMNKRNKWKEMQSEALITSVCLSLMLKANENACLLNLDMICYSTQHSETTPKGRETQQSCVFPRRSAIVE